MHSRETFTWSYSVLLSRLLKLPGSGVDICVPWADMVNHSSHVSAFFEYDASSRSVILRPDKAHRKGEQVQSLFATMTRFRLGSPVNMPNHNPLITAILEVTLAPGQMPCAPN